MYGRVAELVDLSILYLRRGGEIGRHVRFRAVWAQALAGSNPVLGKDVGRRARSVQSALIENEPKYFSTGG